MMKHSITWKITFVIIGLVAGTVLLCWVMNMTQLENYYTWTKQRGLEDSYEEINDALLEGNLYEGNYQVELERMCAERNITLMVMNSESDALLFVGSNEEFYRRQFWEILFAANVMDSDEGKSNDDYTIGSYTDSRLDMEYLVLWGNLADGNLIFMRTALESIRESVAISNKFVAYVGIFSIIVSAVVCYFASRRVTKPILQLAELSRRMTNLEFDAKYESRGKDEFDYLGEHMNMLSETLEKTISELKSANNELMRDLEKRDQMDDMRKEFLANVSHELKTPLALISGYAEGLLDGVSDDAESRQFYCEVILDEAQKMSRMVKQLMTLNQLEFGNDQVVMERFDLTELISGVLHATEILMEQNGIRSRFQQEDPIYVWADEFLTEEVLTNFVSNAINHAEGEKRIDISVRQQEDVVRVGVFNTGKPIPEDEMDKIWDKFYKVDKARTREYGGSGIGLSIVKAIMDSFHRQCGAVNYEDGVEFWFELDAKSQ